MFFFCFVLETNAEISYISLVFCFHFLWDKEGILDEYAVCVTVGEGDCVSLLLSLKRILFREILHEHYIIWCYPKVLYILTLQSLIGVAKTRARNLEPIKVSFTVTKP
jgi:hypothetical protein